jgi:hypothetical protein
MLFINEIKHGSKIRILNNKKKTIQDFMKDLNKEKKNII